MHLGPDSELSMSYKFMEIFTELNINLSLTFAGEEDELSFT